MTTATTTTTRPALAVGTRATAIATLFFGLAVVFMAGFANSAVVHNAAHDTRHSLAFPCH